VVLFTRIEDTTVADSTSETLDELEDPAAELSSAPDSSQNAQSALLDASALPETDDSAAVDSVATNPIATPVTNPVRGGDTD